MIKFLTRLRIGCSHLKEHKFKYNFQDFPDTLCSCGSDIESTTHIILHCANFPTQRRTLLNKVNSINDCMLAENENSVVKTLLFGRPVFTDSTNIEKFNATIRFILTTERFNYPLF